MLHADVAESQPGGDCRRGSAMTNSRWALALPLFISWGTSANAQVPMGAAQTPSPEIVAAERRRQIIEGCKKEWRPICREYGIQPPQTDSGTQTQPGESGSTESGQSTETGQSSETGESTDRPPKPPPPPQTRPDVREAQSLVAAGPSTGGYPNPQLFAVSGFIRSGWPIVVSYQVAPGAVATLRISPKYGAGYPQTIVLPPSPDNSPQYYRLVADIGGSGGRVGIADFSITARDPSGNRAQVAILGFGAGPRAVGSVAIEDIKYDPPSVTRPQGNEQLVLTYSYFLKNDWDRISEDLWRDCHKLFCELFHPHRPYRPARQGVQVWEWPVSKATKKGRYHLSVRAWHICGALIDPNAYDQCGNELDWVIGSAGPVFVQ